MPEHASELILVTTEFPDSETISALSQNDNPVKLLKWHPTLDISKHLRPPKLAHVRPHSITYEQALSGINVQIPGTPFMRHGDTLVFNWGLNQSSTHLLLRTITKNSTVRVLCISYDLMTEPHVGLVDVWYEVYRGAFLIGISGATRVRVNPPLTLSAADWVDPVTPPENSGT